MQLAEALDSLGPVIVYCPAHLRDGTLRGGRDRRELERRDVERSRRRQGADRYLLETLDAAGRALWLTTGIATLMLWAALAATREPFAAHYVSVIFVPGVLAVYSTIARAQLNGKNLLIPFAVAAIACGCVTNYLMYQPLAKAGDWKRVASFVMASESDHQESVN